MLFNQSFIARISEKTICMRKHINPKLIRPGTALYYRNLRAQLRKIITSIPKPLDRSPSQNTPINGKNN